MKTAFRLRKTTPGPATALLLLGEDVRALLHLCTHIGGDQLPAIHSVAGGFLVRLSRANEASFAGAIRLRALSANLFLPVDAELTPALLADEAAALVRQRGLVFLPGGTVVEFAPSTPLTAAELLALPRHPQRSWQPLPAHPRRPDQLTEILLDVPDLLPDAIIDSGGKGIGDDAATSAKAGPIQTITGSAAAVVGKGLIRLGVALGWKGMASLGARLLARAMESVPHISRELLGKQEAALRELLRKFREGKTEEALRRALPLSAPEGRGSVVAHDATLPIHNLSYRLGDLLGSAGGRASVWLGTGDVYRDLVAEYRAAAEDAYRRGDHRRAAFIYGRLLHDWASAASVLSRGGLHHDAGILYLDKLGDTLSAARCFENAGAIDRALFLYRQRGDHVSAGDLLMRAGEPERAAEEYLLAAEEKAAAGHFVPAAELARRAERPDLMERYVLTGWSLRPLGDAVGCLMRLTQWWASLPRDTVSRVRPDLMKRIDEADEFFAAPGCDQQAADFYNRLATLATQENFQPLRDDIMDRALLGLAGKLRQLAGHSNRALGVSRLFGSAGPWEPSVVRDADVAVRGIGRPAPVRYEPRRIKTHSGRVTAACSARGSGDLFLGFADGILAHFDPRTAAVRTWPREPGGSIVSVATDSQSSAVVVIALAESQSPTPAYRMLSFVRKGSIYSFQNSRVFEAESVPSQAPVASSNGAMMAALWNGSEVAFQSLPDLLRVGAVPEQPLFRAIILLDGWKVSQLSASLLVLAGHRIYFEVPHRAQGENRLHNLHLSPSMPANLIEGAPPMLSWLAPERTNLEMMFVDDEGELHWMVLRVLTDDPAVLFDQRSESDVRCGTLLKPGKAVAVHRDRVVWLTRGERHITARMPTPLGLADAVACFASPITNELLVVTADGDVIRVNVPSGYT